jgi:class 3 adenylate cyclase
MTDAAALLHILGESVDPEVASAIERLVLTGADRDLNRVNALAFAARHGLDEEKVVAAFLHATRIGLFELAWNVLCPGCGGVLDSAASLKSIDQDHYHCALCAAGYEPTLDEMVEVTFTISARVRRIAAHEPDALSMWEYMRQIFWSSGVDLPDDLTDMSDEVSLEAVELPAGERALLSVQLAPGFYIVFDPVTHSTQFLDVKGEPTRDRQAISLVFNELRTRTEAIELRPGPVRLSLENRTGRRVLPAVWIAGDALHETLGRRRPFLTANRLLTNQTFRDIYRTGILDVDQRLKIMSLTFLFTDLKGSTELYERIGDLMAFDMVRVHFRMLADIVADEAGAVVKTIGDALMATFPTPDRALAAALRMREAMRSLHEDHGREDMILKIGIHEGSCLAVTLNDRQDYFGQTVNIASRVQNLAVSRSILATGAVAEDAKAIQLFEERQLTPVRQNATLRGIDKQFSIYEIA